MKPALLACIALTLLVSCNTRKAPRQNSKDNLTYVWIPPGKFRMGCSTGDQDCANNEKPPRDVAISQGFWLGETEVTQAAYQQVIGAVPSEVKGSDLPVDNVLWAEADKYCRDVGGKLPKEEQWEYAARGGNVEAIYGPIDRIAWYQGNSNGKAHAVRQKEPNAFGLYDILGNVWEWTDDLTYGPYVTPPPNKEWRLLRGGSWHNEPRYARSSFRNEVQPAVRVFTAGFRCALP